jgi:hypothetical protein
LQCGRVSRPHSWRGGGTSRVTYEFVELLNFGVVDGSGKLVGVGGLWKSPVIVRETLHATSEVHALLQGSHMYGVSLAKVDMLD